MLNKVLTIFKSLSMPFEEREVSLSQVKPLPSSLYIREKVDQDWVETIKEYIQAKAIDPFLVVAQEIEFEGENFLVDTHHTYYALKELGYTKAKAIVITKKLSLIDLFHVQLVLNTSEQKPVSLKEKRESLRRYYFELKEKYGENFWRRRGEFIRELVEKSGLSEKTVYNLLGDEFEREKEKLKQVAYELHKEGKSLREIEELIDVPNSTLSLWIRELSQDTQGSVQFLQLTESGHSQMIIFLNNHTLNPAFVKLLSEYIEEGGKVIEFFKEREKQFDQGEAKRFMDFIRYLVERSLIEVVDLPVSEGTKKSAFIKRIREKTGLSEKACEYFYDSAIKKAIEQAMHEFKSLVKELCDSDEAVSEENLKRLVSQKLDEKRKNGKFGEGNGYAIISNLMSRHLDLFFVKHQELVKDCLSSIPVLDLETATQELEGLDIRPEEVEQELRARFPEHKIPRNLIEAIKKEVEKKREEEILRGLLEGAKDPKLARVEDILPQTEEERQVFKKYYYQIKKAFESVPFAKLEDLKGEFESVEDVEAYLLSHGFRTANAKELFNAIQERKLLSKVIKKAKEPKYTNIDELLEDLTEEERKVAQKHLEKITQAIRDKRYATRDEVLEIARIGIERGWSVEEAIKHLNSQGKACDRESMLRAFEYVKEEKRKEEQMRELEQLAEEILLKEEEEEKEKERGITLQGVRSELEKLLERVRQAKSQDDPEKIKKELEKIEEKIEKLLDRVEVALERKKPEYTKEAVKIVLAINKYASQELGYTPYTSKNFSQAVINVARCIEHFLAEKIDIKQAIRKAFAVHLYSLHRYGTPFVAPSSVATRFAELYNTQSFKSKITNQVITKDTLKHITNLYLEESYARNGSA